jgi:hypothetical protein
VSPQVGAETHLMDNDANVLAQQMLVCEECRCSWLDPRERWRLYLSDDEPPELVPYCPYCAGREFD